MLNLDPDALQSQKALKNLSIFLSKKTIPHALLFTGNNGTGKMAAATLFAMACNCYDLSELPSEDHSKFIDIAQCTCKSCNKIRSGNHPDFHWIKPSGSLIKIEQIRDICYTLSMKPYEAKIRITIISQADTMTPEAANSLLKMLEEPPDKTIIILTAIKKSDLLPTIVSRCQIIRFFPMPLGILEKIMVEKYKMTPEDAAIVAQLSDGSLSKLREKKGKNAHKDIINTRKWIIGMCINLTDSKLRPSEGILLAFSEKLPKDKKKLSDILDIIHFWFRDLIIVKYYPEKIINKDLFNTIQAISQKRTIKALISKINAVNAAKKALLTNANVRLILDVMILQLVKDEI